MHRPLASFSTVSEHPFFISPPHQAAAASLKHQCTMDIETGMLTAKHVRQSLFAICTMSSALYIHYRVVGFPRHRADTNSAAAVIAAGHTQDSLSGNAPRVLCDTGRLYFAWRATSCCSAASRSHSQRYQTSRDYCWQFACCICQQIIADDIATQLQTQPTGDFSGLA